MDDLLYHDCGSCQNHELAHFWFFVCFKRVYIFLLRVIDFSEDTAIEFSIHFYLPALGFSIQILNCKKIVSPMRPICYFLVFTKTSGYEDCKKGVLIVDVTYLGVGVPLEPMLDTHAFLPCHLFIDEKIYIELLRFGEKSGHFMQILRGRLIII